MLGEEIRDGAALHGPEVLAGCRTSDLITMQHIRRDDRIGEKQAQTSEPCKRPVIDAAAKIVDCFHPLPRFGGFVGDCGRNGRC